MLKWLRRILYHNLEVCLAPCLLITFIIVFFIYSVLFINTSNNETRRFLWLYSDDRRYTVYKLGSHGCVPYNSTGNAWFKFSIVRYRYCFNGQKTLWLTRAQTVVIRSSCQAVANYFLIFLFLLRRRYKIILLRYVLLSAHNCWSLLLQCWSCCCWRHYWCLPQVRMRALCICN